MKTFAILILGLVLGYGASVAGQSSPPWLCVNCNERRVPLTNAPATVFATDSDGRLIDDSTVGLIAVGRRPDGNTIEIQVDNNGRVICSPGQQ